MPFPLPFPRNGPETDAAPIDARGAMTEDVRGAMTDVRGVVRVAGGMVVPVVPPPAPFPEGEREVATHPLGLVPAPSKKKG